MNIKYEGTEITFVSSVYCCFMHDNIIIVESSVHQFKLYVFHDIVNNMKMRKGYDGRNIPVHILVLVYVTETPESHNICY